MLSMNKSSIPYLVSLALAYSFLFWSCSSDEPVAVGEPSTISLETDKLVIDEGENTVKLNILLDKPQNVRTIVNFRLGGNATSTLASLPGADYEVITEPPVIIPAGEQVGTVELRIIEDEIFEQELENIILTLDAVLEGNAALSDNAKSLTQTLDIQENDYRLFLEWQNPENEQVNMNLYVELPNKELLASEKTTGFEEVTIVNARENQQYYVDIWYQDGNREADYLLKCLRAGETEKKVLVEGLFNSDNLRNSPSDQFTEMINNHLLVRSGRDLQAY